MKLWIAANGRWREVMDNKLMASMRAALIARFLRDNHKGRRNLIREPGIQVTGQRELLSALMVADELATEIEEGEHPVLKSAIENLIMTAKMSDPDRFATAQERFANHRSVLFVRPEKIIDLIGLIKT